MKRYGTAEFNSAQDVYNYAKGRLEAAHKACFENEKRPVLGMSHGPFSGVNDVLALVKLLAEENFRLQNGARK